MNRILLISIVCVSFHGLTAQKTPFDTIDPGIAGFKPARLDSLSSFLENAGSSSMIILVDGKVAYQWGKTDQKHVIHSIRKALLNSLIGIEVANGRIDTTKTLRELGIDDIGKLSELEKSATVLDLLKSRSGVYHPAAAVHEGMLRGMPERNTHKPNEHYYYNNWDFNVLGAILEQVTGESIFDLFKKNIAEPLGMLDYNGEFTTIDGEDESAEIPNTDGVYQEENSKSNFPAYHFRMSARDMALYGQLYLQKGKWKGEQITPEEWIKCSTKAYSITNPQYGIGYGLLWSVLMKTENRSSTSFYHTGVGIHMLAVYPASNMVLVHRVDTEKDFKFHEGNFYQMINMVWAARGE